MAHLTASNPLRGGFGIGKHAKGGLAIGKPAKRVANPLKGGFGVAE